MQSSWDWSHGSKLCFVTTGATAPFIALIESVLSDASLKALENLGYTHLLVQYGTAKDIFTQAALKCRQPRQLVIDGIDFQSEGLQGQLALVSRSKGLVISHAGSGSILEALRYSIPLVVVPNTTLLDNHQEELAVVMEKSNYLIRGHVKNLAHAIEKSEKFRHRMTEYPPVTSGKHRETKSFASIMDETMGFMD